MINKMIVSVKPNTQKIISSITILIIILFSESIKLNLTLYFHTKREYTESLNNIWLLGCFIGPIFLGWFSDRFYKISFRKPVASISLIFSCITFLIITNTKLSVPLFYIVTLLNGLLGTYLGVSRAFMLDQQHKKGRLTAFVLTIVAQCVTWLVVGQLFDISELFLSQFTHINSILFPILIVFFLLFTSDLRKGDAESKHPIVELQHLKNKYGDLYHLGLISSFFFLSISYHFMPYIIDYSSSNKAHLLFHSFVLLGIGVALGAVFTRFFHFRTKNALILGYSIASLFLLFNCLLHWTGSISSLYLSSPILLIYAAIGGALWVYTLKDFLDRASLSEDGTIFGVFEAFQSLGELAASFITAYLLPRYILQQDANLTLLSTAFLALLAIVIPTTIKHQRKKN